MDFFTLFPSLRSRNFRLFFLGQSISLIGTWMQITAVAWLVWRLSYNPVLLGMVGFVGRIPTFLLAPVAGVMVDRVNRYRLLLLTQMLAMLQALALAALMEMGLLTVWHVLALSLLLGMINAFDMPTRHAFFIHMVDQREHLANAIALNGAMVQLARLIGPTIAGLLIAAVGEGFCFLLNGLSYLAVLGSLLMMNICPNTSPTSQQNLLQNLAEGFRYAFGFPPIRSLLFLLGLVSLSGASYAQLLPIFAQQVLQGDARTQVFLLSASAVGALAGSLYLASRRTVRGLGRVQALAAALFGVGLILLGVSRWLWLSLAVMPLIGLGMILQIGGTNILLQTIVEEDKRGRVMSLYSMAWMGMDPLGSLLAGMLAHLMGAPGVVILGGICCMVGAGDFARRLPFLRKLLYPIYIRQGIIVPASPEWVAPIASTRNSEESSPPPADKN
jgi:MFS family permease